MWKLKNSSINFDFKWPVACKDHPYTSDSRNCDLCLTDRLAIIKGDPNLISNGRHLNKFSLRLFKEKI